MKAELIEDDEMLKIHDKKQDKASTCLSEFGDEFVLKGMWAMLDVVEVDISEGCWEKEKERVGKVICSDDTLAVLYMVSLADYDQNMGELKVNKLKYALNIFQDIVRMYQTQRPVVVLFNKVYKSLRFSQITSIYSLC